jgi:lipopolysaccharide/colanic/teichoic acid biosynthesis glycosyltransferase
MQVKSHPKISPSEVSQYLRVAAIDSRNTYCFLYIGNDSNTIEFLTSNFTNGYTSENFETAKKFLKNRSISSIDIIIMDIHYDVKALKDFQSFLNNRGMLSIPVIYADHHMPNAVGFKPNDIIDDVIDLKNWQYDFSSKVSFLKKTKEYGNLQKSEKSGSVSIKHILKRTLDIIIASFLILLLIPLLLIISLAIKIESKGPVFYNSKRAGRGFKIFNFYKFRTMVVNADKKISDLAHLNQYSASNESAVFFKISNDPRITRVGKFLRNTSLDELPQLFNVLKGDMSLVGNRPLPLYEAASLTTNDFVERFMAPAGITGLWQIKKRGQAEMSAEERINLDISYARKETLLYDLWIMANTPKALFQKNNV